MEYRPFYIAREWVRLGHEVTIVAASHSHLRHHQPALQSEMTVEVIEGIRYIWLKTPQYSGNGVKRVVNMLAFVRQLYRHQPDILSLAKPHSVIASSTYPLDILPARSVARSAGAKLVFEVHDLWPLSPMELGGMSRWHPFILMMQWGESIAYRSADVVVSMLPKAKDHMVSHGMDPVKFNYVPNGIDVGEWERSTAALPEVHQRLLAQLRRENRFIVGYAGSHGVANSLVTLISAAQRLQGGPAAIVLVGQGPEKDALMALKMKLGLENVHFLPAIDKSAIPSFLKQTDSLFIGWQKQPLYRFGISPNKLMDYMMAGKPVIHAIEAGNDPVAESGCGISVVPENPEAIIGAVEAMMNLEQAERDAMGKCGQAFVRANHDYKILAERFLGVMR